MSKRAYTHVKELLPEVQRLKSKGYTHQEIANELKLENKGIVERLLSRECQRERNIEAGQPSKHRGRKPALLLPQTAKAVERGEPLLCLGAVTEEGIACGALAGYLRGHGLDVVDVDYTITLPEHQTLAPFFEAVGFVNQPVGTLDIYGCTLKAVAEQPFFSVKEGKNSDIVPFSPYPISNCAKPSNGWNSWACPFLTMG